MFCLHKLKQLVDHNPNLLGVLRAPLEFRVYTYTEADHGVMASERIETLPPDLGITDNKIRVWGGLKFFRFLKRKQESCFPLCYGL